jgi:hypothetical protein
MRINIISLSKLEHNVSNKYTTNRKNLIQITLMNIKKQKRETLEIQRQYQSTRQANFRRWI